MAFNARRAGIGLAVALTLLLAAFVAPVLVPPGSSNLESCGRCIELARLAPADADEVALVPGGGSAWFAMWRHPIREDRIFGSTARSTLVALALGRNPVIVWRRGERSGAAALLAAPRHMLLRLALPASLRGQTWTKDGSLIAGETKGGFPIEALLPFAQDPGQLFFAHRGRSSIPGVSAPAVSSVELAERSLSIVSRSRDESAPIPPLPAEFRHPSAAMVSVALGSVSELVGEWDRILPVDAAGMGSGLVVIYGVESGTFLPRVRGVVVSNTSETDPVALLGRLVPAVDGSVSSIRRNGEIVIARREAMGLVGEAAIVNGLALLALDGSSMDRFLADRANAQPLAGGAVWSLRASPGDLRLAIRSASDSMGYKILSKRTRNSVKGLSRSLAWIEGSRWVTFERTRTGPSASVTCRVDW